jgi:hypothetical protein
MRSTADAPWNSQRPVRVTTQAQQWTPGLESQSLPKEAKTQSPSVPLALKFRSRIMIAIRNGEPSVDNTDISLGGAYGEPRVCGPQKHLRTGLTSGTETRLRPRGTRHCTQPCIMMMQQSTIQWRNCSRGASSLSFGQAVGDCQWLFWAGFVQGAARSSLRRSQHRTSQSRGR